LKASSVIPVTDPEKISLDDLLVEVEAARGEDPEAALARLEDADEELQQRPEARLLASDLTWETSGAESARPRLEELVRDVPDYADARHLLGCIYDELGQESAKVEQFLEVLRLDEGLDPMLDVDDPRAVEDVIVEAAEGAVAALPEAFRERLTDVPILVEPRPSEELVREGFDPRALGLFEGPTHAEREQGDAAQAAETTRIVLYSANLASESLDEDQLRTEVATTVWHEVGHYFGLDEDELTRMGLD